MYLTIELLFFNYYMCASKKYILNVSREHMVARLFDLKKIRSVFFIIWNHLCAIIETDSFNFVEIQMEKDSSLKF